MTDQPLETAARKAEGGPTWAQAQGWRRDSIHYPSRPLRPLDVSYMIETIAPGSAPGCDEWSLPVACVAGKMVNGWVYTRIEPFGDPPKPILKFQVLAHLWRVIPPLRRRVRAFDRWLADGGFEEQIDTWEQVWRPEAERRIDALRRLDVGTADRNQMADHLEAWHEHMVWQWSPHVRVHLVCFFVRGKFAEVCSRLLGLSDLDSYELIKRSDPLLFEPSRKLSAMARRASGDASVADALRRPAEEALDALSGTWFGEALDEFLDAHGDVPVDGFELALPTWRELPDRVVGVVQQILGTRYDPAAKDAEFQREREARVAELRARLSGDALAEFDRWLALGERAYPLNDTHNYLLLELPAGLIRYAALHAGDLLVAGGAIAERHDVFFLSLDELTSALRSGDDVREVIERRKLEVAFAESLDPPDAVGGQPPIPPVHVFPPRVAEALLMLVTQSEQMYGMGLDGSARTPGPSRPSVPSGTHPSVLTGIPGSPGVAEGPVRVVAGVRELDRVRPGDILVCPITGPAWTVVFPMIAGLVTEAGGPLSHPAIVAREYGIPSVVGTGDATKSLHDGQRVRVDGAGATVTLLDGR